MSSVVITEEQARWFRARRSNLAGGGAADAATAVRSVCGIQAQQEGPALLGLSQRMAQRPDAPALARELDGQERTLVRTWGQRDTLHLFDAQKDWFHIVSARSEWAWTSRLGPEPSDAILSACVAFLNESGGLVKRKDLFPLMTPDFIAVLEPFAALARMDATRLAASRTLWQLARLGEICIAGNEGSERLYAARKHWFPDLAWPEKKQPLASAAHLVARYLAAHAPASTTDIAHFFGVRVREAAIWVAELEGQLIPVICGARKKLFVLQQDLAALQEEAPATRDWPLRFLPLWDGLLMGHKDKSLIIPEETEQKQVWRKGSFVAATVLVRGRIAGVWAQEKKGKRLKITLTPLRDWRDEYRAEARAEAMAVAHHQGFGDVELII